MSGMEIFQIWLMALLTLALFSFMYKDNPIYRVAEHIFAGLTVGYQVGLIWHSIILQQLWMPMYNDGDWTNGDWWKIVPGILGLLMMSRLTSKFSWVSRTSLAFVMGTTAGIFLISELHGRVLPQMQSTMITTSELVGKAEDEYKANLAEFEVFQVPFLAPPVLATEAAALPSDPPTAMETFPQISAGALASDKPLVFRDIQDSIILSVEFVDPEPLAFGEFHAVGFDIRHSSDLTMYSLALSTIYGNDNIVLLPNGDSSYRASLVFDPQSFYEVGKYDLYVKVERRSVMFLLSVIIVIGVLSTLIYFYFSKEHKGALGVTAQVGIWFIMISFGAHFGYTVMGRVSLLIGRVQFLIEDWIGSFF